MFTILLISIIMTALYIVGTRNFNYWKKKGVVFEKPTVFFGNSLAKYTKNISQSDWFIDMYRRYPNEKYIGYFSGSRPSLILRDPELIKHVLVADFKHFHYRGLSFGKNNAEPMMKNILFAEGDLWKLVRQKLTPAFSSGKLKAMFPLIINEADKLSEVAEKLANSREEIDIRELMARYTTDFIGACGFGIDSDALSKETSDFRNLGKKIFSLGPRQVIIGLLKPSFPNLFKKFNFFDPQAEREVMSLVKQIMSQRNYKPSGRNDFIDMMLELRQKEKIIGESMENFNPDGSPKTVVIEIDDLLLAAQVFIFFAAGFETSSYASSILLHVLAYHPKEQARCQKDIDQVLARYDGKLSYDSLKEMKYLEMAFKESMRILPSPSIVGRRCTKKYTFSDTNLTIDEGVLVIIPMEALHLDDRFYKDPEEFRPERFHPDNVGNILKNTYMPFGDGPRACIGERMGVMQSLAGAATILRKFTVVPSKSSVRKPRINPNSGIVKTIIGGLPLSLKIRK